MIYRNLSMWFYRFLLFKKFIHQIHQGIPKKFLLAFLQEVNQVNFTRFFKQFPVNFLHMYSIKKIWEFFQTLPLKYCFRNSIKNQYRHSSIDSLWNVFKWIEQNSVLIKGRILSDTCFRNFMANISKARNCMEWNESLTFSFIWLYLKLDSKRVKFKIQEVSSARTSKSHLVYGFPANSFPITTY